jgi:hypothetical protein
MLCATTYINESECSGSPGQPLRWDLQCTAAPLSRQEGGFFFSELSHRLMQWLLSNNSRVSASYMEAADVTVSLEMQITH